MGEIQKMDYRLPSHVRPIRYKIMLRPNFENFTFSGEESIQLVLDKTTNIISLHAAELDIQSVEFIHQTKEVWAGNISYQKNAETVTFTFPKKVQKGRGELKLKFSSTLNDKMRGFYRSTYTVDGQVKHLATTQFEATDARRAFPSFDEPAQKAIFDVTLMIPSNTVAISNTIESNVSEHESGYKIVEFEPTPKMSTYLLAFIVGEFEYIEGKTRRSLTGSGGQAKEGILVRVFTTPGKKHQAKFARDCAVSCLEFYENYFGIDYPLPVLDMIAIPDFSSRAMENWGAITYRESTILVDEEKTSVGNKQWVALVIAHEIAHQWFGNLVTMEWWTHLWLNEGFASFIEYLAIDHIFPTWDIWTQFAGNEMGIAFKLDALQNTHPIEIAVGHPAEISEIFDKVSYAKGASVLRMLYAYLGPNDFRKGLQHYLKTHAYENAETEDLWESLEKISKKPVRKVMENWTSKAGHPVITVSEHKAKLKLEQSRFFSSPISKKKSNDRIVWSIPLRVHKRKILIDEKFALIDKPKDFAKLNTGEASFVRIDYPKAYLKHLEEKVKNKELEAVDRLGLIRDTFGIAQSGGSPTSLALDLVQSYKDEKDYTVWLEITRHLNQLDSLLAYEVFYDEYKRFAGEVYRKIAYSLGWEKKRKEKYTDGLLRGIALYKLGSYGNKETILEAQNLFVNGKDRKIDPDIRGVVYQLVAENGDKKEFDTLLSMYKSEDNQQEKDRIGGSMGRFGDKEILSETLKFAISKHVRYQSSLQIIASVWSNPFGRYLAWEFVKNNWELLKKRYAGGHYFTRVFLPAGEFTKKKDAKDIENFVRNNPVPEAQRTIAQAVEQIYANAEWLSRDKMLIQSFLLRN